MGEPNMDWEMQEDYTSDEESSGKVSWILRKGLVLGKKILVTGVVMSSAPIVLPPLLMISAFGFAVSVPSGIFLASYACSEKLMSKLLPGHSLPGLSPSSFLLDCAGGADYSEKFEEYGTGFEGEFGMEDEEEEEQIEDTGRGVPRSFELPIAGDGRGFVGKVGSDLVIHDTGEIVEEGGQEDIVDRVDKRVPAVNEMQGVVLTIEADDRATLEGKGTQLEVRDVVVMESAGRESIEDEELARETKGLIEKLRDEGREPGEVAVSGVQPEHEKATVEIAEDVETLTEAKDAGKKGKRKGKKKGKVVEKIVDELQKQAEAKSSVGATTGAGSPMKEHTPTGRSKEEKKEAVKDAVRPTAGISAGSVQHSGRAVNGREKSSEAHPGKRTNPRSHEGPDGEEKIWKQIEAMRVIVGYKATPHASCLEELKALYVFTGVEPPESSKDISNLEELHHKLRFLMSIVGVK